jgi:pyruvate formate lyase activating enzyme
VNTAATSTDVVGAVHSWDISTGVDGPGTRFVVFTQGCPLRCQYCQNPDTWHMRDGQRIPATTVIAQAARYTRFIAASGGGATISGGEPLLQPAFAAALLRGFKDLGLHTALDTSGFLGVRADQALLEATDLVLLDIKSWDRARYRALTGGELEPTLVFARRLADRGIPVHLRFVLVPGLTDVPQDIDAITAFAASLGNVERVDVLPFHTLGVDKYRRLRIPFPLEHTRPPTPEQVADARSRFAAAGLTVV